MNHLICNHAIYGPISSGGWVWEHIALSEQRHGTEAEAVYPTRDPAKRTNYSQVR